jgi:hypothetical protein
MLFATSELSIVAAIFASLAGLIGLAMLTGVMRDLIRAPRRRQWEQTTGVVLQLPELAAKNPDNAGENEEAPLVRVRFEVDGVAHESHTISAGMAIAEAEQFVTMLTPGDTVYVFYDPHNPGSAALFPPSNSFNPFSMLGFLIGKGIALCIGGLLLGVCVLFWTSWAAETPFGEQLKNMLPSDSRLARWYNQIAEPPQRTRRQTRRVDSQPTPRRQNATPLNLFDESGVPLGDPAAPSVLSEIDLSGPWRINPQGHDIVHEIEIHKVGETTYEFKSKGRLNTNGVYHVRGKQLVKQWRQNDTHTDIRWTWRGGHFEVTSRYLRGTIMYRPGQQPL